MKRILCVACSLALCAPLALGFHAAYGEEFAPDASVKAPAAMAETAPSLPQAPENSGLLETPTTHALEASDGGMSEVSPLPPLQTEAAPEESGVVFRGATVDGGESASPDVGGDYLSPLVTLRADPYLYKHEGMYYFTGSYPQYDRIELTAADSVNGIAAAVPKEIWHMDANFKEKYVWAPELHYIMGQWVIYFAYSQGSLWDIKCCALRCTGDDPMHDEWQYMGAMKKTAGDGFSFNSGMSLDMTVFYHEELDKWYAIWAQKPSSSNLYIAELADPFTLATQPMLLTQPDYDWEKLRESVNEGPAVLQHAGKIFVSFSAAATGYEYCMGLLEIDACDDPMVKENWTKYPEPVFQTDESLKIYGPGHNCFVEGDNGEQLCILHFRDYKDITGDSLLDFNRHAHVMKITFDRNGVPQFHIDKEDLYNSQFSDHK